VETARKSHGAVDHEESRVSLEERDALLEREGKTPFRLPQPKSGRELLKKPS
jgi:hypothetical protein